MKTSFAVAVLLTATAATASAAPITMTPAPAEALSPSIERVHYRHRSCQLGRAGWHFHTIYGERIPCRPFRTIRRW